MTLNNWLLSRIAYIIIFAGCFFYLTSGLSRRHNTFLSLIALAISLLFVYIESNSSFVGTLIRYLLFTVIFSVWSCLFLEIRPRYALYLSVFCTIFMGVWFSIVQIFFQAFSIENTIWLILCTGFCRICSILIIKHFFIQVDNDRDISFHEMFLSLFPAVTCFIANLVLYELIGVTRTVLPPAELLLIYFMVLFFGLSAMIVLVHSESYFRILRLQQEKELAQEQLNVQYQFFLKEQENAERIQSLHHDIKKHLHTIEQLASAQNIDLIHQYVSNLKEFNSHSEDTSLTGNMTLDAVLNTKLQICKEKGISLTNYLSLRQIDFLSPMEICTLFANALDNAIEAVSDPAVSDRYIHLSGGNINGNLVVKIENPYAHALQPNAGHFLSTKKIDRPHGYGLLNIEKIIQDHDGTLVFKTDNHIFTAVWTIPIPDHEG